MIKVGDLVATTFERGSTRGIVTDVFQQKHWDTNELGVAVNWSKAPMRDFARVLAYDGREHKFLVDDLHIAEEE